MFEEIIDSLSDFNKVDGLEKVKKARELGYNVYCRVDDDGVVNYNMEAAKVVVKMNAVAKIEKTMYQIIEKENYKDIVGMLRKYDYRERAITENAKCTVVFFALIIEAIERIAGKEDCLKVCGGWIEALEDFTTYRVSSRIGRCIEFSDLIEITRYTAESLRISDNFYDACLDYIMNMILKYKI